jgi:hypothetical protein
MTDEVVAGMLAEVIRYKDQIDTTKILPRVRWTSQKEEASVIRLAAAAASD